MAPTVLSEGPAVPVKLCALYLTMSERSELRRDVSERSCCAVRRLLPAAGPRRIDVRGDVKLGLAAVALMAVCCGGPVFLSLLASGAALGALGSVWSGGCLLLPVSGALLIAGRGSA